MTQEPLSPDLTRQVAAHHFTNYFVNLPAGVGYDALFDPGLWVGHKLRQHDLVRVRAADGTFDCQLSVVAVMSARAVMERWPSEPVTKRTRKETR